MNDLINTEFFSLMKENSQEIANEEIQNAYGNFVEKVETLNQSEIDYSTIFRLLNLTRIEFKTLHAQILYEQGEKCS